MIKFRHDQSLPPPPPPPVSATEDELPNQLSVVERRLAAEELRFKDNLWRSNYHEAAIFIEEGMNNDKFENHPRKRSVVSHQQQNNSSNKPTSDLNYQHDNHHNSSQYGSTSLSSDSYSPTNTNIIIDHDHVASSNAAAPATTGEQSAQCQCLGDILQPREQQQQQNHRYENMIISSPKKPHKQSSPINYNLLGGQFTTIETYILVHNRYFYQLDLLASLVLMLLALFEPPAVPGLQMNTTLHAAIEIFALSIIAMELILKFRWVGPRRFFNHGRTVTKILVLSLMIIEAIVMTSRQVWHARYSRALRPIFLIDNHYCNGIRRVVRQIFQSIPAIFDMFILAIFFLFVFSIFGFYLLAPHNAYFSDMVSTIGNLVILATTANMPDIILPSYAVSRWSAIYFVLFVIIHLFLLTNLTMAAVYESFTRREKEKFHKLFLHRRKACQEAFKLLVSRKDPNHILHRQFMGLMKYLNRKYSMFEAYLIFKALDSDRSGSLSLDEFYQIYDFLKLDWRLIYPQVHWYDHCDYMSQRIKNLIAWMHRTLKHRYFEWIVDGLIALTAVVQFLEATAFDFTRVLPVHMARNNTSSNGSSSMITQLVIANATANNNATSSGLILGPEVVVEQEFMPDSISTGIFITIYAFEALWRLIALGVNDYWSIKWNRFDLFVLLVSMGGLLSGYFGGPPFEWVIVLRVLRLVRRFEFKRRYKDLWQTLTYILLKRFVSMVCVVMILYYFFAIIGMELMSEYTLRDCCKNTTNEVSFKFKPAKTNGTGEVISQMYYLNDFTDIVNSYLTLFSMTGSTYWLAVMNAYAIVANNEWLRIYFGLYYLCSIIVMNIVIAFILESFLFRIQYRNKIGDKCDDANLFTANVSLSSSEVNFLYNNLGPNSREDKNFELMARAIRKQEEKSGKFGNSSSADPPADNRKTGNGHDNNSMMMMMSERSMEKEPLLGAASATTTTTGLAVEFNKSNGGGNGSQTGKKRQQRKQKHSGSTTTGTSETEVIDLNLCSLSSIESTKPAHKCSKTTTTSDNSKKGASLNPLDGCFGHRSYFIYQAEQTRNKFSFTLKMYADEVVAWLAEAQRNDQNPVDLMISRNQIRAEQVALARLLRRNLASNWDEHLNQLDLANPTVAPRNRSYSSSGNPHSAAQIMIN